MAIKGRVFLFSLILISTISIADAKVKVGQPFPKFELKNLNSKGTLSSDVLKGKVVLVDFWGSDCPPCRLALPQLNKIFLELKTQPFTILGINVDDNDEDTAWFLKEYRVDYPLVDDRKHQLVKYMGIEVMRTTYLIDKTGKVKYINSGFKSGDSEKLKAKIMELLKSASPADKKQKKTER